MSTFLKSNVMIKKQVLQSSVAEPCFPPKIIDVKFVNHF